MKRINKKVAIITTAILVLIYIMGVVYFNMYSFPNTKVNGEDRSFLNKSSVFIPNTDNYSLVVKGRTDKQIEITSKDISLESTVDGKPELNQNSFLWPVEVFKSHEHDVKLKNNYNENKLVDLLEKSDLLTNMIEPVNADIEKTDEGYSVKKEVVGDKLDKDKLISSINNAISNFKNELVLEDEYINPTIYADNKELNETAEKMNKIFNSSYVFDFSDRKWELKGDELLEMFDHEDSNYVLNKDKVFEYIKQIAIETDTYNRERKFNATGIGEITVPGGIYGWQMNVGNTLDNLIAMIDEDKSGEVEIAYNQEALHRESNDIGNTYIEIDLSRQHMWFYKDGELFVDTPVVSGTALRQAATPTGVNKVWSKEEDTYLIGANAVTGERYKYPVKYWMPVGWTGSGIHDTYSRTQYGGDIYKYNGSSSCINTPEEAAKTIYDNVPMNTAVVIYESSTNYSPTEFEKQAMMRNN